MAINYFDIIGEQIGKTQTGLNISVNGMDILISEGNINGVSIPETILTFATPSNNRQIDISLVKKIADGTGEIWVDNRVAGRNRANTPAGYELIEVLCWFLLPAGTTDLASIDINVRRIV